MERDSRSGSAIIGAGAVSDYHHVPGIRLDPRAELSAACDADPALLEQRKAEWGIDDATTDPLAVATDPRSTRSSSPRPTSPTGRSPWPPRRPASTSCARSRWA